MVTTELEHYSIYIHSAHDDEMFHHGLKFGNQGYPKHINRVRIAFIFRWLSVKRKFRCNRNDEKCNRYSMVDKYAMLQLSKHHESVFAQANTDNQPTDTPVVHHHDLEDLL